MRADPSNQLTRNKTSHRAGMLEFNEPVGRATASWLQPVLCAMAVGRSILDPAREKGSERAADYARKYIHAHDRR